MPEHAAKRSARQVACVLGLFFIVAGLAVVAVGGHAMAQPEEAFLAWAALAWIDTGLLATVAGSGLVVVGLLLKPRPGPGEPPVPRETVGGSGRTDAAAKQRARESIASQGHRDDPIFPATRDRPWTRDRPAGASDPGPSGPSRG